MGLGHGPDGSQPDYTYNANVSAQLLGNGDWTNREARTLQMELEVFGILQGYGDPSKAKSFSDIQATLEIFNKFKADEDGFGKDAGGLPEKIKILNDLLTTLGYAGYDMQWAGGADSYSKVEGAANRGKNLRDAAGNPLSQADYLGTILPK